MKRVVVVVAFLILATLGFFVWRDQFTGVKGMDRETRRHACNYLDKSRCDKSCATNSDCKQAYGGCVNSRETVYAPQGLSVAFSVVDCSCQNSVCVGTPTGEIAI